MIVFAGNVLWKKPNFFIVGVAKDLLTIVSPIEPVPPVTVMFCPFRIEVSYTRNLIKTYQ